MKSRFATLGVALAVAACGTEGHRAEPADSEPGVTVLTVESEQLPILVPVEGSVLAPNRAEITTRMMARITSLEADVGTSVRRGQVIIRLGAEDIAANRARAEAAVMAAQAAWEEAQRHMSRMDTLHAQDVVSAVQRDQARLQLTRAESQLSLANAATQDVETAASYAIIRAPFDGEVVARFADEGDVAAPGIPLLVLEETGPRDARLSAPPDVAGRLNVGNTVRITTLAGHSTEASIRAVAPGADPTTRTVEVRATLPSDWPTGISVTALLPTGMAEGVAIPATAVVRRGQLTGVRVFSEHGTALRWIRLGRALGDGERVQVLSGLNPGDRIVP